MKPSLYESNEVRRKIQECPHRRLSRRDRFGPDYECHHPGATSEYERDQSTDDNYVMIGGADAYATFCPVADEFLAKRGEPSRLYVEGEFDVVDSMPTGEAIPPLTVR